MLKPAAVIFLGLEEFGPCEFVAQIPPSIAI
jgi:hypothetical protein